MKLSSAADVPPVGSSPAAENCANTSWDFRPLLAAALSVCTIAAGVFFGAYSATHEADANPGTASATVGSSGTSAERCGPVTARARRLPALTCGSDEGMLSNISWTWPPIRSVSAGALTL
ncbi:Uncharacterised protein [Bordetella pertussis]|nr:Uncharacterised protein [Bordetella pertussis]